MSVEVKFSWAPILLTLRSPSKISSVLSREFNIAGRKAGKEVAKLMRAKITDGIPPANRDMTTDMKGSTKTLVDDGHLWRSVTSKVTGTRQKQEILVGVMRSAPTANIAKVVHEGMSQVVTLKMEVMFKILWLASTGKSVTLKSERARELLANSKGIIPPLKEGTLLVVPPRPFALLTVQDPKTKMIVEKEYRNALKRAWEALQR